MSSSSAPTSSESDIRSDMAFSSDFAPFRLPKSPTKSLSPLTHNGVLSPIVMAYSPRDVSDNHVEAVMAIFRSTASRDTGVDGIYTIVLVLVVACFWFMIH